MDSLKAADREERSRLTILALWLFAVTVTFLLSPSTQTAKADFGLEFCDDFGKSARQQRDPYEERLETERHDFTQSAVTVGRHVFQVESGYSLFYRDNAEETEYSHTAPEMLIRLGLSEDIEFRARWNYVWQTIEDEPNESGSEDLRLSLKFQLTRPEESGLLPTSALETRITAPTGSEIYTTEQVEFSLDYIYQWQLAERVTIAGSTGFATNGFGDFGLIPDEPTEDRFLSLTQSAVLGMELSEANTMYVEWFSIFSDGLEDDYVVSIFNIGIDHYVTDDFVLDIRAGVGLSEDSDDFFTGIGGGYRF